MLMSKKNIFLLHNSNSEQYEIVEQFHDALPSGSVDVKNFVNVADGGDLKPLSLEWLNRLNNVLLIHLTSETIEEMGEIIRQRDLADKDGYLHEKLFTVTFGEKLTGWPPQQLKRRSSAARDFYFRFPDPESSPTIMAPLVEAIVGNN